MNLPILTPEEIENPEYEPEITFVQFRRPLDDENFFLLRCVDDVPTHWMTPYGMWVGFPEDDEEATKIFEALVDSDDWPKWGFWDDGE